MTEEQWKKVKDRLPPEKPKHEGRPGKDNRESTQIGLRTCRKIMEEHRGAFAWYQKGESFVVELRLPVSPREA